MARPTGLIVALVVLVGLSGVAVGQTVGSNGGGGMVTVTANVADPGGDPVRYAELTATWDGGSTTATTAANGQALLDVPKGTTVSISVQHADYIRNEPYVLESVSGGEVSLTTYPKAQATITIVDETGAVVDAKVQFRKRAHVVPAGPTDSSGTAETGVVEAGEYVVSVFKPGYYRTSIRLDVSDGTRREIQIERGVVDVTFRVLDNNFEPPRPIAEATISGSDFGSVKTQANGIQRVSLPVNSRVPVTVEKDGYRKLTQTVEVGEQPREIAITTRKKGTLTIDAAADRVVVGEALRVVVTDSYGTPLSDATVTLNGRAVGSPDDMGVLLVPIESAGEHEIRAKTDAGTTDPLAVVGVVPGGGPAAESIESPSVLRSSFGESVVGFPVDPRSTGLGVVVGMVLTVTIGAGWKVRQWTTARTDG